MKSIGLIALFLPLLVNACEEDGGAVALGVLARERVVLTATANEIVTELPVPEGSHVTVGTVLVRLDDTLQKANVAVVAAQLDRARADLDKLRSGARPEEIAIAEARVDSARASFTQAETVLQRNSRLLETQTITQAQLDEDIARRNAARADLTSAEQALAELRAGAREEDIRIAEAQVAAAEAQLDAARTTLGILTIRASRDGLLDSLPWNLGERVPQGSPVANILAGDRPFARVYVPEQARVRLTEGVAVPVRVDGLDAPLEGTLRWISSEPAFTPYYALNQEQRSRLVYLAEIALPEAARGLPSGVPVEAVLP